MLMQSQEKKEQENANRGGFSWQIMEKREMAKQLKLTVDEMK